MQKTVEKLLVIQERDQKIRDLNKELARLPVEEEQARARLADDNAAVAGGKKAIQENEIAMKNFELDIDTRKDSVMKLKMQQFETRKNDEFAAIGTEIKRYESEITKLEDSELELMELGETLAATLGEAKERLAETQSVVDEELAAIAARKKNSEERIVEIKTDRKQHAAAIEDEDDLQFYEAIFKKKGDAAVVPLKHDENCGGCHMKLIKDTVMKTKAAKEITQCQQCGRILYEE
ncbi:MAG: putative nucleic acid-binding Zn-ribbon protein [Pseudoalteromonas tetraodonis]|jgi:predicted  nucleic acid-binding Zn-ribbon protein